MKETEKDTKTDDKIPYKMRMPRGYGSIRYLGKGRRRPYAVHSPAIRVEKADGVIYRYDKPICYAGNWLTGFFVLIAWHTNKYENGMEENIYKETRRIFASASKHDQLSEEAGRNELERILSLIHLPANTFSDNEEGTAEESHDSSGSMTIYESYEKFYEYKFGAGASKKLKKETAGNTRYLIKKLEPIYDRDMDSLTVDELQCLVNDLPLGKMLLTQTVVLLKQLYKYAVSRELCTKNPAQYLQVPDAKDVVHHQDFTDEELKIMWDHAEEKIFRMLLIMCYSGFRITEFEDIEINIDEMYFRGGIKTDAGRDRIVPVHSGIFDMVKELKASGKKYLIGNNKNWFRRKMADSLKEVGIDAGARHHSPHSCRHTFSRLCESFGVREADRKRMMGHSFNDDITNGVYGHRSLEELRAEIEKIKV